MADTILLQVHKGCLLPADKYSQDKLRARKYSIGDVLSANLKKPRNPKFHRLAHALGQMVSHNIEDFKTLNAHEVLKKIQIEADISCDTYPIRYNGEDLAYRVPKSISFASMDESEFKEFHRKVCLFISEHYWLTMTAEQISEMVELFD